MTHSILVDSFKILYNEYDTVTQTVQVLLSDQTKKVTLC